jgi:hypothetical protein
MMEATSSTSPDEKQMKNKRRVSFSSSTKFTYQRQKQLEQGFVLDGVCVSHLTNDETERTFPSINIGIPQYKAQSDKRVSSYFKRKGLPPFVTRKQEHETSMQGRVIDKFCASSEATAYLTARQKEGAGCTRLVWGGHTSVPTEPAVIGWHGEEGYRRNTFDLRARYSVFDYEDPFENPRPLHTFRQRTQSAPATIRLMRQKSASVYRSFPGGRGRRAMSAIPRPQSSSQMCRTLATGPVT